MTLKLEAGRTSAFAVTVRSPDGGAYSLTSATLYFTMKSQFSDIDSAALISKSSPSSGIAVVDAAAGTARIDFAAADTTVAMVGSYLSDLVLKSAAGEVYTIWQESFEIQSVVRRDVP